MGAASSWLIATVRELVWTCCRDGSFLEWRAVCVPANPGVVMGERLPVIYVRGFGGGQSGIDRVVDDPFYGFNEGSTHIRVGARGRPRFYQFEGPLLRLMVEQGYQLRVGGDQLQALIDTDGPKLSPESVWVYRYYDASAGTFGREPRPYNISEAARGLAEFVDLVRSKTKGKPRVDLVAHSMGGLICRTALQREMPKPETVVSKLVTVGTPHGGIDVKLGGSIGDWVIDTFGPNGSDIFSPNQMREYMLPDGYDWKADADPETGKWDARKMVGSFPPRRVLSIVGTNSRDYDVAIGLSSKAMGEQSDGLVAIKNAYVRGSSRAYVHRSHSGRYGLVNSEEAYQGLRRFLFGSLRIEIELDGLDKQRLAGRVWQADVRLAIRGLPVLIHEQTTDHQCPVDLNTEAEKRSTPMSPVPLVTTFLLPGERSVCRYALHLKVISLKEEGGLFGFLDHLEQIGDWEDSLIVDVVLDQDGLVDAVEYAWNSTLHGRVAEAAHLGNVLSWTKEDRDKDGSEWRPRIPLPESARVMLGDEANIQLRVSLWD
jgi:pimeloyl-ACP methyl ester carboxylesterase